MGRLPSSKAQPLEYKGGLRLKWGNQVLSKDVDLYQLLAQVLTIQRFLPTLTFSSKNGQDR
jgi:hypothetical protein